MYEFDADHWMNPDTYGHDAEMVVELRSNNAHLNSMYYDIWNKNAEENAPLATPDRYLSQLYGQWDEKNCLVCGAGPTLKAEINDVKKAVEKGWKIVSVDRAHSTLKDAGINPDFTITADASNRVVDFLYRLGKNDKLLINATQDPRSVRRLLRKAGEAYIYMLVNPFSDMTVEHYKKYPKGVFALRSNYTVGVIAIDFAVWMGARNIALIGCEMGWHKKEDIEDMYWKDKQPIRILKNNYIDRFYTIDAFIKSAFSMADMFVKTFPRISFFDCSAGIIRGFAKPTSLRELVTGISRLDSIALNLNDLFLNLGDEKRKQMEDKLVIVEREKTEVK